MSTTRLTTGTSDLPSRNGVVSSLYGFYPASQFPASLRSRTPSFSKEARVRSRPSRGHRKLLAGLLALGCFLCPSGRPTSLGSRDPRRFGRSFCHRSLVTRCSPVVPSGGRPSPARLHPSVTEGFSHLSPGKFGQSVSPSPAPGNHQGLLRLGDSNPRVGRSAHPFKTRDTESKKKIFVLFIILSPTFSGASTNGLFFRLFPVPPTQYGR